MATRQRPGRLYRDADEYARRLAAYDRAQAGEMLAAWRTSYQEVLNELTTFLAQVERARQAGEQVGASWAFRQQRMRALLETARTEMARYADAAAGITEGAQQRAQQAGLADSSRQVQTALEEGLPGLEATFVQVNPRNLERAVGFLADGSVLRQHLAATLPEQAVDGIRSAIITGLAKGRNPNRLALDVSRAYAVPHTRAVTIMRTEVLRAYREASRAEMLANADTLEGWTWHAALDARTCVACAVMHGTQHPVGATLDGHPRCRCAMVPRTRSWEDILGPAGRGIPDTRPRVQSGTEWLEELNPAAQLSLMGPQKYRAWKDGRITLEDMVARTESDRWGTMRTERSLVAILEGRHANYSDSFG